MYLESCWLISSINPKTKTHPLGARLILCSNLSFGCCCRISTCIHDQKEQKEQRPHLRLLKLVKVWCDIEEDSIQGTGQRDATAKQDEQHEVRVRGREVHHLRGTKSWLLQNNLSKPSLRSPENICHARQERGLKTDKLLISSIYCVTEAPSTQSSIVP